MKCHLQTKFCGILKWSSNFCVDLAWNDQNVLCCSIECMHDMYRVYIESGPPVLLVYIYL